MYTMMIAKELRRQHYRELLQDGKETKTKQRHRIDFRLWHILQNLFAGGRVVHLKQRGAQQ